MSQRWIISKKPFAFGAELNVSLNVTPTTVTSGDTFVIVLRDASAPTTDNSVLTDILYQASMDASTVFMGATKLLIRITSVGGYAIYKNGNGVPFLTGTIPGITFSEKRLMYPGFMTANAGSGPVTSPIYSNVLFQVSGIPNVPEETFVSILPGQNLTDFYKASARDNIDAVSKEDSVILFSDIPTDASSGTFVPDATTYPNPSLVKVGVSGTVGGNWYQAGTALISDGVSFTRMDVNLFNSSGEIEADVLNRADTYATLRNFVPGQAQLVKVTDKGYSVLGDGVRSVSELAFDLNALIGTEVLTYTATSTDIDTLPEITDSSGNPLGGQLLFTLTAARVLLRVLSGTLMLQANSESNPYWILPITALDTSVAGKLQEPSVTNYCWNFPMELDIHLANAVYPNPTDKLVFTDGGFGWGPSYLSLIGDTQMTVGNRLGIIHDPMRWADASSGGFITALAFSYNTAGTPVTHNPFGEHSLNRPSPVMFKYPGIEVSSELARWSTYYAV